MGPAIPVRVRADPERRRQLFQERPVGRNQAPARCISGEDLRPGIVDPEPRPSGRATRRDARRRGPRLGHQGGREVEAPSGEQDRALRRHAASHRGPTRRRRRDDARDDGKPLRVLGLLSSVSYPEQRKGACG